MRYLHTSIKKDGVKGLSCEVKSTQVAYLKSHSVTQKENLTFEMPSDGKDGAHLRQRRRLDGPQKLCKRKQDLHFLRDGGRFEVMG